MVSIKNLNQYLCAPGDTIQKVLERLNSTEYVFQLVVDSEGRLLGTLTDGDIRRALLSGLSLDNKVELSMHKNFLSGNEGDHEKNRHCLVDDKRLRTFLPILDDYGVVVEVLVRGPDTGISHALIMAGGFGKRLGEKTKNLPKPLLNVGGQPILEHVLKSLEAASVKNIFISVHYHGAKIKDFINDRNWKSKITIIEENTPLDTAGAIGNLPNLGGAPVLVVNGDVISNVDLTALHDFHLRNELMATVAVAHHEVKIPFGVIRYGSDGIFSGIEEKPTVRNFVAAGIYYISSEIQSLVSREKSLDMPSLLNQSRELGMKIGIFPIHEYWTDVGHPRDLEEANDKLDNNLEQ
ncbi:MAG: alcohol dehydrogenase [Alphaproteobacteria bacterium]|nr:alcohol dehydrogenase [Alphaproteobacteria bacterium]|tara:strand:- start:1232 stop:2284 length:1053 start_codon:yes stop_codon:yes gene_type:complete